MITAFRALLIIALAAIVFEIVFAPRAAHRALDPDEPIAADGSMIAGKARTIYDTNPLLGAFSEPILTIRRISSGGLRSTIRCTTASATKWRNCSGRWTSRVARMPRAAS
jgi:hypothetical protein